MAALLTVFLATIGVVQADAEGAEPETLSSPPQIRVLLREGDMPEGGEGLPVSWLGSPVTHGADGVAFSGVLDDGAQGDGFIWRDGAIVWRHSQAPPPGPTVASPSIGIGQGGQFVFRTLVDGLDTIWSHQGAVVTKNQPAPGLGEGATILLSRRATMTPDGRAHWVSEFRDGAGQMGQGRVLYGADGAAPDKVQVLLRSDQIIDGLQIARPWGLDLRYDVSPDGSHLIQPIEVVAKEISDQALCVDGSIAYREGEVVGSSASWAAFRQVAINDHGDYLFSAETEAPPGGFTLVIAYNGEVVAREGGKLGDHELTRPAEVLALAIDNRGRAAHLWSLAGFGIEGLFFACDAADLGRSSLLLAANTAGNTASPLAILRFEHVGHSQAISFSAESDKLYAAVSLKGETAPEHAILEVKLPACPDDPIVAAAEETPAADPAGADTVGTDTMSAETGESGEVPPKSPTVEPS